METSATFPTDDEILEGETDGDVNEDEDEAASTSPRDEEAMRDDESIGALEGVTVLSGAPSDEALGGEEKSDDEVLEEERSDER